MTRRTLSLLAVLVGFASSPAAAFSVEEQSLALPGPRAAPAGVTSWDLLGKATVLFTEENGGQKVTTMIPPEVETLDGRIVRLTGFMFPVEAETPTRQFLLVEFPADCPFCLVSGSEPSRMVEVNAAEGMDWRDDQVVVSGRLEVVRGDENGLVYRLREARLAD